MKSPRLLCIIPSLFLLATPLAAEVLDRVVVKVNGEILSLSDFQTRQIGALRQAQVPAARQEAYLRQHSRELLDAAIDDLLISQAAAEDGKDVPEDYLKQVLESIKKDYNIQSDEEFERRVREEGLTVDDVKRDVRRSILTRRYIAEQVERKVVVSDTEERAEYERRKASDFTMPPTERLAEILISSSEPDAEKRATQIVARLKAGEDFAELARAVSTAATRASGGDLGTVARGSMNASLVEVVSKLQPGQVSSPLSTKGGYRILKVVSRDPGRQQPFAEVAEKLRAELRERRRTEVMAALTKRLRERADIEEMVRDVPLEVQVNPSDAAAQPSLGEAASAADAPRPGTEEEVVSTPGRVRRVSPPAGAAEPTPAAPQPTP
jgi:parvulin-like peptidyl-prolyl isomerase